MGKTKLKKVSPTTTTTMDGIMKTLSVVNSALVQASPQVGLRHNHDTGSVAMFTSW